MEKDEVESTKVKAPVEDENLPGYGYWKRDGDLVDSDKFIPKPVKEGELQKQESSKSGMGSAWNSAGTWEEKHYKKYQIEEYFNSKLTGTKFDTLNLHSIKNFSGDAYTIVIRNKAKLVYDCSLVLEVSSDKNPDLVEIEINEINNHELDVEFEHNHKKMTSEVKELAKKNRSNIDTCLKNLFLSFWEAQKNN